MYWRPVCFRAFVHVSTLFILLFLSFFAFVKKLSHSTRIRSWQKPMFLIPPLTIECNAFPYNHTISLFKPFSSQLKLLKSPLSLLHKLVHYTFISVEVCSRLWVTIFVCHLFVWFFELYFFHGRKEKTNKKITIFQWSHFKYTMYTLITRKNIKKSNWIMSIVLG